MPPEVVVGLATQIPLVAVVAYGFLSRRVRSAGEIEDARAAAAAERERMAAQHERELRDKEAVAVAWQQLYERERDDRRALAEELGEGIKTLGMALELVKPR